MVEVFIPFNSFVTFHALRSCLVENYPSLVENDICMYSLCKVQKEPYAYNLNETSTISLLLQLFLSNHLLLTVTRFQRSREFCRQYYLANFMTLLFSESMFPLKTISKFFIFFSCIGFWCCVYACVGMWCWDRGFGSRGLRGSVCASARINSSYFLSLFSIICTIL